MKGVSPKISKEDIIACLNSAKERLRSAEILLKAGQFRDSISRSYYALLDAVHGLLLTKNLIPKSHEGAVRLFGIHFVKPGLVDKKYGRYFHLLLEEREDADYEKRKVFSQQEAKEALEDAREFVGIAEKLLKPYMS
ncbi:MAG: HEPN domain-containing protein [Candidatus Omnitrophica bacterium]|nr:HEPN domain-containing protein [Candidatus Omnitrophota bacterium]